MRVLPSLSLKLVWDIFFLKFEIFGKSVKLSNDDFEVIFKTNLNTIYFFYRRNSLLSAYLWKKAAIISLAASTVTINVPVKSFYFILTKNMISKIQEFKNVCNEKYTT